MKKLLNGTLIVALLVGSVGCSDGTFTTPSTSNLHTPDHAYEIDTWGSNSELYEFTPKTVPTKSCVVFILDSGKSMAMQCFDKEIK